MDNIGDVITGIESMTFTARNGVAALNDGNPICVRQYLEDIKANKGPTLAAARRAQADIARLAAERDALRAALEVIATGVDHPAGQRRNPGWYASQKWSSGIAHNALAQTDTRP